MAAGTAMMHGPLIPCAAALTGVTVAGEDGLTMTAEAPARVGWLPLAAAAKSGDCRNCSAAAEEAGWANLSDERYS